jgi:TRAP-type transport system periplasmic protein
MKRRTVLTAGAGIATGLTAPFVSSPARAETVLRAITAVPMATAIAQVFGNYMERVNARGRGVVRIQYLGGPEVTPSPRQAASLQRGLVDIIHCPGSFYAGEVAEVDALLGANRPIQEMRANGAMALLDEIWGRKINAKILGWFDTVVAFHMYTAERPRPGPNGVDLTGVRMFTTPTFRDFQVALGATPVAMALGEIRPSMDRGVIQGFGYPNYGLAGLGLEQVAKWRIDPDYYRGNTPAIINRDAWNRLSAEAKQILTEEALRWEVEAAQFIFGHRDREYAALRAAGMQILTLEGDGARRYRELAFSFPWQRMEQRAPDTVQRLRTLVFDEARLAA